jgi:(E)-4-hydroxy-3-methylbut-2-enyl-diphosphate synthase
MRPIERRKSQLVRVRDLTIGDGAPIVVQSMTTTDTRDVEKTIAQIKRLEQAGCELVRVAVINMDAAHCLGAIKKRIRIPLVADIHFDFRLALEAIRQGVDKLRLNPGNITNRAKIEQVTHAAQDAGIPIRVGVNSGSLAKDILIKYEGATPEAMMESALREIEILESVGFKNTIISLKSTDVRTMIESYRLMARKVDYPLHLGVTEAGAGDTGVARSAVGIGTLLEEGIGDTLRCSLTGDSAREVKLAYDILGALGLRWRGVQFISCPTCGRIGIDLEKIVNEAQERLAGVETPIKVSLIGCVVNGIGEAGHSDIGLVGHDGFVILYRKGQPVARVPEKDAAAALADLVLEDEEAARQKRSRPQAEPAQVG